MRKWLSKRGKDIGANPEPHASISGMIKMNYNANFAIPDAQALEERCELCPLDDFKRDPVLPFP
jgi:hypothetical protein